MVKLYAYGGEVSLAPKNDLKKLYVELTSGCNLSCKMCYRRFWSEKTGNMTDSTFNTVMNQLSDFKNLETVHFGGIGEPLFHPRFLEYAKKVKDMGYKLYVSTNGTMLNNNVAEELVNLEADFITVSFDSSDDLIFKEIRGIEKKLVYNNIKNLTEKVRAKGKEYPKIELEFVAMKSNIKGLPDLSNIANEIGASRIIISNLLPMSEDLTKEIVYNDSFSIENPYLSQFLKTARISRIGPIIPEFKLKTERACDFIDKKSTVVAWDGEVSPCYRLLHTYPEYVYGRMKNVKKYSFGNINEKKLKEIWNGEEYMKFRWIVKSSSYPSCIDCVFSTEGCYFVENSTMDCYGNSPSCADCLWARRLILCP